MERQPQRFCPPSELGNPQRTRVSTFPQRRRRRLSKWDKLLNPRQSYISTDSRAEPFKETALILPFRVLAATDLAKRNRVGPRMAQNQGFSDCRIPGAGTKVTSNLGVFDVPLEYRHSPRPSCRSSSDHVSWLEMASLYRSGCASRKRDSPSGTDWGHCFTIQDKAAVATPGTDNRTCLVTACCRHWIPDV